MDQSPSLINNDSYQWNQLCPSHHKRKTKTITNTPFKEDDANEDEVEEDREDDVEVECVSVENITNIK
jgi:hypothetical protein